MVGYLLWCLLFVCMGIHVLLDCRAYKRRLRGRRPRLELPPVPMEPRLLKVLDRLDRERLRTTHMGHGCVLDPTQHTENTHD